MKIALDAKTREKTKKILNGVLTGLFVAFFVLCVFALIYSVAAKKNVDGTVRVFGREMRLVLSSSMEASEETDVSNYSIKDIPTGSIIFVQPVPEDAQEAAEWYAALQVGDVLTFRYVYVEQQTITHRIVQIAPNDEGGYTIVLEGDNKAVEGGSLQQTIDTSLEDSPNYVIGKVTGQSRFLGFLIRVITSVWGIICIVIVPCLAIIVLEVIHIVDVLSQKKKQEAQAEREKQEAEIAELKRQLAAVKAEQEKTPAAGEHSEGD